MVKRRVIRGAALVMAILLCTFVLMSCTQKETTQQTGQTQPTQAEKDKTWETKTDTLRVATVSVGSQLPANEAFTKATGVKLEWVEMGQDDLHTKMATAFAAGNMDYDLIWSYAANTAEWASVGYLEDITDKIDKAIMEDLNPGSFDATVYKGRFYGLPRFTSVNILWYNKAIFREANLDPESPPKTWEEFVDAAKKTTYDSDSDGKIDKYGVVFSFGTPYGATIQWELLLYLNGGKMFDENDNVTFNDEKGVAALKMLRELFDLGVVEPVTGVYTGKHGNVNLLVQYV
jgi:multiple sugar transport system substrate-binding protein